jgi:hypothetical protein
LNFILNQINVIILVTNIVWKNNCLGFFKFYQHKATGGGFLIFEWTLSAHCKLFVRIGDQLYTKHQATLLIIQFPSNRLILS